MPKDEVELGEDSGEDFEMVPVGPIRKLERRIDEMEQQSQKSNGASDELVRDVLDIMKSNQKIVNDMTESTHELKNSVEDLTHKMDSVIDNMNSFMDLLKEASEADMEGEVMQDVHTRIADAVGNEFESVANDLKESNREVVENLQQLNKSVKRSYTSQNKEEILSGRGNQNRNTNSGNRRSQSPSLNPDRGSTQENDNSRGNNQGSRNIGSQGRNNDQAPRQDQQQGQERQGSRRNYQDNDRMKKLRERFNKENNE
ncbi:MAG: hypothetical protein ABEJ72_04380 [Candidatus Aenigmatarchaeota archaeon]